MLLYDVETGSDIQMYHHVLKLINHVVYTFGQCQFNMIDIHNSIKGAYMSAHF